MAYGGFEINFTISPSLWSYGEMDITRVFGTFTLTKISLPKALKIQGISMFHKSSISH